MCAGFAAHGRPGLSNRECHWIAPMWLTAVQPGLRPAKSYFLTEQDRRARGTRQQDTQDRLTNKRIQTSQPPTDTRREEVTVSEVCDDGAGGPLHFLVISVSWHQAQHKKQHNRKRGTKTIEKTTKGTTNNTQNQTQAEMRAVKAQVRMGKAAQAKRWAHAALSHTIQAWQPGRRKQLDTRREGPAEDQKAPKDQPRVGSSQENGPNRSIFYWVLSWQICRPSRKLLTDALAAMDAMHQKKAA